MLLSKCNNFFSYFLYAFMKIFSLSDDSIPEIFCISIAIKSPSHELARVVVDFS